MTALSATQHSMSVPLRHSLVMSVTLGKECFLPAGLFSPDIVGRLVLGVTDECLLKILVSSGSEILLILLELTILDLRFSWNVLAVGWEEFW